MSSGSAKQRPWIVLGYLSTGFLLGAFLLYFTAAIWGKASNRVRQTLRVNFTTFVASIVDEAPAADRKRVSEWLMRASQRPSQFQFEVWIVSDEGKLLFGPRAELFTSWSKLPHPQEVLEYAEMAPGAFSPAAGLVRISGNQTVIVRVPQGDPLAEKLFWGTILTFIGLALMGLTILCSLVVWYLRSRANEVRQVMRAIKEGDLKQRFVVGRFDEAAGLMSEFNEMANQISNLVEDLSRSEAGRITLLREIEHDLRTPLGTIRNISEILGHKWNKLNEAEIDRCLLLLDKEQEYLSGLLRNLFVMAEVSQPKYQLKREYVLIGELVVAEAEFVRAAFSKDSQAVVVQTKIRGTPRAVYGDKTLLERMVRNGFANARKFCRSKLIVEVEYNSNGDVTMTICDDGPGFTPESLLNFGSGKIYRTHSHDGRDEILHGLGTHIMMTIAGLHGGTVEAHNRPEGGARVVLRLTNSIEITIPSEAKIAM